MSSNIILSTLNSSYQHTSFGLRYLHANMDELQEQTQIIEFTIQKDPRDIAEVLLSHQPKIIGFGVYIWNTIETQKIISIIKKTHPEIMIVLGGPEVSYEAEGQKICQIANYVIKGEADFAFRDLCRKILAGEEAQQKIIPAILPDIKALKLPYDLYSTEDIRTRYVYVEASRGCPYKCEYCLSSLDKSVRSFDLEVFLSEVQKLLDQGARSFKFIDRTFNLSIPTCTRILNFFLDQIHLDLFLHFEMVPDRLPVEIRDLIKKFPKNSLQFEIGIQSFNTEVAKNVSRRNDFQKVKENFEFLAAETGVYSHADLIVGLPGENIESFAKGFDTLWSYQPNEIQVGILKRLKGAPISRHDLQFQMVYSDDPPFQILKNKDLSFQDLQIMNRFAKFWDLIANSGNFPSFLKLISERSKKSERQSFFWQFYDLNQFLSLRFEKSHSIALMNLAQALHEYLIERLGLSTDEARAMIIQDYSTLGKRDIPNFLKTLIHPNQEKVSGNPPAQVKHNKRQQRHMQAQT